MWTTRLGTCVLNQLSVQPQAHRQWLSWKLFLVKHPNSYSESLRPFSLCGSLQALIRLLWRKLIARLTSVSKPLTVTNSVYEYFKINSHKYKGANKTDTSGKRPLSASALRNLQKKAQSTSSNKLLIPGKLTGYYVLVKAYPFSKGSQSHYISLTVKTSCLLSQGMVPAQTGLSGHNTPPVQNSKHRVIAEHTTCPARHLIFVHLHLYQRNNFWKIFLRFSANVTWQEVRSP